MIRVLLADDHTLVREGIKHLLALSTDIVVTAEASNGAQALDALQKEAFDVILLDMNMPGISGPDLIQRIRARGNHPPILVLSMHAEALIVRRALSAGISGYLTKDSDPPVLLSAIRKVALGGRFIDPTLAESIVFEHGPANGQALHYRLSDRELQVFYLLGKGKSVNQIASELAISSKTVSTHKAHLMEKMGFANGTDLIRYAIQHGLID